MTDGIGRGAAFAAMLIFGCASVSPAQTDPILKLSEPVFPRPIEGTVVDAGTTLPLPQSLLRLYRVEAGASAIDSTRARQDGSFAFRDHGPGHFVLRTYRVGYAMRQDTLVIGQGPPPRFSLLMTEMTVCLGGCRPNPALVKMALESAATWACTRSPVRQGRWKQYWTDYLATTHRAQKIVGSPRDPANVAESLELITDDATCRRAAASYSDQVAAVRFTLFRWKNHYLIAQETDDALHNSPRVLTRRFQVVWELVTIQE